MNGASGSSTSAPVRSWRNALRLREAAAKALGTGIRNGLAFNQFEVYNDELGAEAAAMVAKQTF